MSNVLSEEKKQQVIALGKARMAATAHRASHQCASRNSRRLPQGGRDRSTSTARLGATSAGGQARVIAYVYGNADLKKLNEATVLASRQAGQVNELERDRAHVDSVDQTEVVGVLVAPAANPNELLLTAGDCMFLLEVGIRP